MPIKYPKNELREQVRALRTAGNISTETLARTISRQSGAWGTVKHAFRTPAGVRRKLGGLARGMGGTQAPQILEKGKKPSGW